MDEERKEAFLLAAEGIGGAAALLTWVFFGAMVVGRLFDEATWSAAIYAALSLTIVRMLPVWLCLRGTGVRDDEALFMGWFGPRGLASIVFVIMAIDAGVPGADEISVVVGFTVLFSIIAHGLSAKPLAKLLAKRLAAAPASGGPARSATGDDA